MEHPDRWHRDQPGHRGPFGRHGPFGLRERHAGHGGPLRRDPADRLGGGVAAGIAAWRGFSPTTVRIVFVLVTLVSTGWGVPLYVLAWLFIPAAGT
ncbi:MAG TPA: PspC domain-containing protein, partial [Streptosporangiaceae bacterium]|nr:PspC domain-containing protein [Streptosporangiaceae bacterium]